MRFDGIGELTSQIAADRDQAAALLEERAREPGWFANDNLPPVINNR